MSRITEPDPARFASKLLEVGAHAYAHSAAENLARKRPDLAEPFGPQAIGVWRDLLATQIRDMAHAIADRRPADFSRVVAWSHLAFSSRAFPSEFLRESLAEVRRVLESEVPPPARTEIEQMFISSLPILDDASRLDAGVARRTLHPLAKRYVDRLLAGDARAASAVLTAAIDKGELTVEEAYVDVCLGAQHEIGCLWHRNELSIAVEHFVTAAAQSTMSDLFRRATLLPRHGRTALAATIAGDRHEVGLRATADLLEIDGWKSVFLGADVPIEDIASAVLEFEADLVVISGSLLAHRRGIAEAIASIRGGSSDAGDSSDRVWILVGGSAFDVDPERAKAAGADAYASDPRHAVTLARGLLAP